MLTLIDMDSDPVIAEMIQMQRDRRILVVAAVVGIVASAALGMAFSLGALGAWTRSASGPGNPASLIFFIAPFAACMALGYAVHAVVRRLR